MIGNFFELGPWLLRSGSVLEPNPYSWNRLFGLMFLDNPIGAGFSIASTVEEIPRDQTAVAKHLFAAITSFLRLYPSFKTRPVYITGESYAGKYVPAIGYYILKENFGLPSSLKINLAGVAIGDGLTHPVTQVATHALQAYYSGLIDEKQKTQLEKLQSEAVKLTKAGNWSEATDARNRVLNSLTEMTGLATLYDLRRKSPYETNIVADFLLKKEVKRALGVNESMVWEECSEVVGEVLHEDVMKSAKFMVEYLVKKSKVLLYQGQFDLRDGVVSVEAWVKEMEWEGINAFLKAEKKVWRANGELAGYVKKWGSLSQVVVLGAGHLLPADQGLSAQAMVEEWVLEKGLFGDAKKEFISSKSRVLL